MFLINKYSNSFIQKFVKAPFKKSTQRRPSPPTAIQISLKQHTEHTFIIPNASVSVRVPIIVIVIVIVISKLLKRYSKAKRTRAPAYSRALRRIKGGFPKGGQEKLRSEFQSTRRGQSSC